MSCVIVVGGVEDTETIFVSSAYRKPREAIDSRRSLMYRT
jgi:hypothetical protein